MKKEKTEKSLSKKSRLLLLVGFAFFINPVPFGLDILPDAFGCIFVWYGLTQLAYFDGSVEEARRYTLWLAVVELFHLLVMRSVFLTNISSNRMLAVSVLSIALGILYVLIIKKLFGGISYFAVRNNCNKALSLCDGAAFMSYIAFFVRIAAMLIPELIAIFELRMSIEVDFEIYDSLAAFVGMKPVIVVLFNAIALGVAVAWYLSFAKLINALHLESGEMLDSRYRSEFSEIPEKTRPKKLRFATYAVYFALFFIIDFTIDGNRVIPASFMFLLLFFAVFAFNGISDFKQTKKLALPAFILLFGCEVFTKHLNPNGAVVIYETKLSTVIAAAVLGIAATGACMLCVRSFLYELRSLSLTLGFEEPKTTVAWVAYCIASVSAVACFVIPYFYSYLYLIRLVAAAVFVWQTVKTLGTVYTRELERCELM